MAWGSWEAVIKEYQRWLESGRSEQKDSSIHVENTWLKISSEEYATHMLELVKTLEMHPIIGQVLPGTRRLGSLVLWLPDRDDYQLLIQYIISGKYAIWLEKPQHNVLWEQDNLTQEDLIPVIIAYLEKLASDDEKAESMRKRQNFVLGDFVRIPLTDGSYGYGRVLSDPYTAFYNYRTTEPSSDIDLIETQPLLFTQSVRVFLQDRWVVIGNKALEGEVARPVVSFMQDLADFRKCTIFDSAGMERPATPEECIGLERAAVWDSHHIAQRLLDTFMGRPNEEEIRSRVRLE